VDLSNPCQMRSPRDTYVSAHWLARFPRFSSFLFLSDQLVGGRAVVHVFFDFAKGVTSGSADPTKWLV